MYSGQTFDDLVESLSKRSSHENAYPRPDLIDLSEYLKSSVNTPLSSNRSAALPDAAAEYRNRFAVVYDVTTGSKMSFSASPVGLVAFSTRQTSPDNPSILFMRGFPTARWLTTIGQAYRVSPELYRRHLDFYPFNYGRYNLYSSQPLPSVSWRVFQLTIPTICKRKNISSAGYAPEDLQAARRSENEAMRRYFQLLRTRANPADSIVRKCHVLSKQEYVLEQSVSIEVSPASENWHAIVWMDNGRDLAQSVSGPWLPQIGTLPWQTQFSPVIVNSITDTTPVMNVHDDHATEPHQQIGGMRPEQDTWRAAQNICWLPFEYGSLIMDKDLARGDALYSLSELFLFAASAEAQLLNFIEQRIEHEISLTREDGKTPNQSALLLNLKYLKALLASHAQSLAETTGLLRNRHSLNWPRIEGNAVVDKMATLLLTDFEYLLQKAHTLAHECEQGMATLANIAVLEESRHSAEMARKVQKLTTISTVFIPLAFMCSVWGMNFAELGSGKQPIWMFGASLLPAIILAYIIYSWDFVMSIFTTGFSLLARYIGLGVS